MIIKKGASIAGLRFEMRKVLVAADKIWSELGQELVVTSGLDGAHSAGSLHYYGLALDFRTNYFTAGQKREAANKLTLALQSNFDVVTEHTHIHVECDIT